MNEQHAQELDPAILAAWRADAEENDNDEWFYPIEPVNVIGIEGATEAFDSYIKRGVNCPRCAAEGAISSMYTAGEGYYWSWECSRCGYHANGPDHYEAAVEER